MSCWLPAGAGKVGSAADGRDLIYQCSYNSRDVTPPAHPRSSPPPPPPPLPPSSPGCLHARPAPPGSLAPLSSTATRTIAGPKTHGRCGRIQLLAGCFVWPPTGGAQAGTGAQRLPRRTQSELENHTRRSRGRAQVSFVSPDLPSYPQKKSLSLQSRVPARPAVRAGGAGVRGIRLGFLRSPPLRKRDCAGFVGTPGLTTGMGRLHARSPSWSAGLASSPRLGVIRVLGSARVAPAASPSRSLCFFALTFARLCELHGASRICIFRRVGEPLAGRGPAS